ncbi:MAG: hypothetical protein L0Y72_03170 [Gemmataceae bacterium]|nr:hypothetical protein [Gemmataceae bacterium]MCI0738019.1 hypothetical protein [Gemmataceae bacterium]
MNTQNRRISIGATIVQRLRHFADALKKDKVAVSQKFTCRTIRLELTPAAYNPALVKSTRNVLKASQSVFAAFLGVSAQTVKAWEQGENKPSEMACRFMDEIRHNPEYWFNRLTQAIVVK